MKLPRRVAYLDCVSGASGDMILGAILDCGVTLDDLRRQIAKVPISGYSLDSARVSRGVISATKAIVKVKEETDHPHHGRSLRSIVSLIEKSRLDPAVCERAVAIFRRLGEAEARVHGTTIDEVHFHEVGAVDAIVDVVGASAGFALLGIDVFYASEIPLGSGEVVCQHGRLPVPAPAVVRLLEGADVSLGGTSAELVTPTGAAILATLVEDFQARPRLRIERSGFGAGDRDLAERPNVFRLVIGTESQPSETPSARVVVLETNLDDAEPRLVAHAIDRLLAAGALDVFAEPIQMKKGRLGTKLSAIVEPDSVPAIEAAMFRETPTFGIRRHECERTTLVREWQTVATRYGSARVKVGRLGAVEVRTPEFEDCRRLSETTGAPLREVVDAVSAAARPELARSPAAPTRATPAPRRSRAGKRSATRRTNRAR